MAFSSFPPWGTVLRVPLVDLSGKFGSASEARKKQHPACPLPVFVLRGPAHVSVLGASALSSPYCQHQRPHFPEEALSFWLYNR